MTNSMFELVKLSVDVRQDNDESEDAAVEEDSCEVPVSLDRMTREVA